MKNQGRTCWYQVSMVSVGKGPYTAAALSSLVLYCHCLLPLLRLDDEVGAADAAFGAEADPEK